MEATDAAELFQKCTKLRSLGPDMNTEVLRIVVELGKLALAIMLARSYVAATPLLRSDIRLYLPEYRERRKQVTGYESEEADRRKGLLTLTTEYNAYTFIESEELRSVRETPRQTCGRAESVSPLLIEYPMPPQVEGFGEMKRHDISLS